MNPSDEQFHREKNAWQKLGEQDPLWAVLSYPGKDGGQWDENEFFETGKKDVETYHRLLKEHASIPERISSMLDFGCGVGRLSRAWSDHCVRVTGVDVSPSMVERARTYLSGIDNVEIKLNQEPNLGQFGDDSFQCVTSHICLQHIPPANASAYIAEFGRIVEEGGAVAFQMPINEVGLSRWARWRKAIIEALPFGLGRIYRRLKGGPETRFNMFCLSDGQITATAASSGLSLVHREKDSSAGEGRVGYIYVFRKCSDS